MVTFVAMVIPLLKPKRRWLQFSLSTLFIVVTLFCVWLSNRVNPVRLLEQQLKDESEDVRHDAARKLSQGTPNGWTAPGSFMRGWRDFMESTPSWPVNDSTKSRRNRGTALQTR